MRPHLAIMSVIAGLASLAGAQVTRVATFENFPSNTIRGSSFVDPLSGILFRDSTAPPGGGFGVSHSDWYFGGGNYLSAGGGEGAVVHNFGFTGDLPAPARSVSVDVICAGAPGSYVTLQGLNATGAVVGENSGPAVYSLLPFTLQVESAGGYDIARVRVVARAGAHAYDNVAFTVVPEPALGVPALVAAVVLRRVRRRPQV